VCAKVDEKNLLPANWPEFHVMWIILAGPLSICAIGVRWSAENKFIAALPDWIQLAAMTIIALFAFTSRGDAVSQPVTTTPAEGVADSSDAEHENKVNVVFAHPRAPFRHNVQVLNRGASPWRRRRLCLQNREAYAIPDHRCILVPPLDPGQAMWFTVTGTAPTRPGVYRLRYKIEDELGDLPFRDAEPVNIILVVE
jgi:hypothetical protein